VDAKEPYADGMRIVRNAVIVGFLALLPAAGYGADSGAVLERLLRDYRNSESRLDSSSSMELSDQRYLERYEDDLLPAYVEARRKINAETRAELDAIDRASLKGQDQLSYDIFSWSLSIDTDELKPGIADRFQMLPLNQFNGAQITFARDMKQRSDTPMERVRDYDATIRRMLGFTRWMDQAILNMREGIAKGVTQPRSVIERMIARKFTLLDTQWLTPHLEQFGAKEIPRSLYLHLLNEAVDLPRKFADDWD
jgi:uncharacterized protein (DUF885 family)